MLTNKIFNASALSKLYLSQSLLPIKSIYAFYQIYICLLSNVNMITVKIDLKRRGRVSLLHFPTLLHYFVSTFFH